jgi:hypothetical protein
MQRPATLMILMAHLIFISWSAAAQSQHRDYKESLRGLEGFYLISQFTELQPEGLTTNSIIKGVKTALQEAGIPVDAEPQKTHGDANLSMTVSTIKDGQLGLYLFTVQVAVIQEAQLSRPRHRIAVSAQTWMRNIQGLTTPDRTDVIEQALKRCVDAFVADYRAVNCLRLRQPNK